MMKEDGEMLQSAVIDMIRKCLHRDAGWKNFYDKRVRETVGASARRTNEGAVRLAAAERRAETAAQAGDTATARDEIQRGMDAYLPRDDKARAPYLERLARYVHRVDPAEAARLQQVAHARDSRLLRPPAGVRLAPPAASATSAPSRVRGLLREYGGGAGVLAAFQALKPVLSFGSAPKRCEQAMKEVAAFFGAEGMRPEHELQEGPDNLLLWPGLGLVIEAKTDAHVQRIPKKHAAQLLLSMEWFKREYPNLRAVPVLASRTVTPDKGVVLPEGTRIITPDYLAELAETVELFLVAIAEKATEPLADETIAGLLEAHGLSAARFLERFTTGAKASTNSSAL